MPQRQKSKHSNHKKRHQPQDDSQGQRGTQDSEAVEKESPPSSSLVLGDTAKKSSALQRPCSEASSMTTSEDVLGTRSDEGDQSQDKKPSNSSEVLPSKESSCQDSLAMKVDLLEQFLLYKYKMKQPITKEDMLKTVNEKCQEQFAEILKRASHRIEVMFAVYVKEVDPTSHLYDLVSMLKLPNNGRVRAGRGFPKTGLLMTLLGVILMKGNCATEEDIWKVLNMMRVFPGRKHFIYGEPRKLITKDLVRLNYLVYQQVPESDPPRHEFLWGPRAYAETSKMKVLEFFARVNNTNPSDFSAVYEEALAEEEWRAQHKIAANTGTTDMVQPV